MTDSRRRGRLFRDAIPDEPVREKPVGALVRQTDHTLPPHDGSLDEPPEKPSLKKEEPKKEVRKESKAELKTESKGEQSIFSVAQQTPKEQAKPTRKRVKEQKTQETTKQETARGTMVSIDNETKKNFRFVERLMNYYGFHKMSEGRQKADIDLYRDTPIRLLGYSEEVGEALRPFIPKTAVRGSYLMTSVYILADTMDKTVKTSEARWESKKIRQREIEKTLIDTLAWQGLASIVIPGVIINRSVYIILYVMGLKHQLPKSVRSITTASICLAIIPTVVKPIDKFVDYFLDNSLRRMLKRRQPPY